MMSNENLFGNTAEMVKVIGFQKRRLQYLHCIFFSGKNSRKMFNSPQNPDKTISIEFSGDEHPQL